MSGGVEALCPLFEAFLYVWGCRCCFFSSALFSLFFTRAVSLRTALSMRMLGMYMSRAVTSCLAESLARVSSWTPVLVRATFFVSGCSRNLPPFLERESDGSRSPGSSTRLSVIHLFKGQGVARAAWRRHRVGGPVPMGGQPWRQLRARGRPGVLGGAPQPRLGPLLDPQRGPQFSCRLFLSPFKCAVPRTRA